MEEGYKYIGIYFDSSGKLVGVPCGEYDEGGDYPAYLELDVFFVLEPAYDDNELENFISKVFEKCFSKIPLAPNDTKRITAIQKYTKAKSYVSAVKGYQYIDIQMIKSEDCYIFTPTVVDKEYKGSFIHLEEKSVKIPLSYERGDLAKAFREVYKISLDY